MISLDLSTTHHYYSILKQLQVADIILLDLSLYLDTHPEDLEAIQKINHYYLERKTLVEIYEKNYGPLLSFDPRSSTNLLKWMDTPWPWQI